MAEQTPDADWCGVQISRESVLTADHVHYAWKKGLAGLAGKNGAMAVGQLGQLGQHRGAWLYPTPAS